MKRISFKTVIMSLLVSSMYCVNANALPVMNDNVSTSKMVTMYKDHIDKNKFYIAPNFMGLVIGENNVPLFSYNEYKKNIFKRKAIVQSILETKFNDDIEVAITELKKRNAKASIHTLPFLESKMKFGEVLNELIEQSDCDNYGAQIGAQMSCSFRLSPRGRNLFKRQIKDNIIITMTYEYTISGCILDAKNICQPERFKYGVAAYLGGGELMKFPQLFKDHKGRLIKWKN